MLKNKWLWAVVVVVVLVIVWQSGIFAPADVPVTTG
jgi:cell division septal protein FtsQ